MPCNPRGSRDATMPWETRDQMPNIPEYTRDDDKPRITRVMMSCITGRMRVVITHVTRAR